MLRSVAWNRMEFIGHEAGRNFYHYIEKGIGSKLSVNHSALEEYLKNVSYQTLLNKIFKNLSE